MLLLAGCGPREVKVIRTYEFSPGVNMTMPKGQIIQIRVMYVPREQIHEIARNTFERDGLPFNPAYRYEGFFDYRTRTLYCEKWDAVICGHELFHATDGDWHK
jgi:hypothetical protein